MRPPMISPHWVASYPGPLALFGRPEMQPRPPSVLSRWESWTAMKSVLSPECIAQLPATEMVPATEMDFGGVGVGGRAPQGTCPEESPHPPRNKTPNAAVKESQAGAI